MKNKLTFANIISVILENKKRSYIVSNLYTDLFSLCRDDIGRQGDTTALNSMFSKWGNPDDKHKVPLYILDAYDSESGRKQMLMDMSDRIIPNLVNVQNTRHEIETLISDSIPVIGRDKADELLSIQDYAEFLTEAVLYSLFCDHKIKDKQSPDIMDRLLSNRLPKRSKDFVGRSDDIDRCSGLLSNESPLYICGVAGIGKSEFVKAYAAKYRKQYTNIIHFYYTGNLKRTIAGMRLADDVPNADEETLFSTHYNLLQHCFEDTLVILDNFDVYPNDDPLFNEFIDNRFHLLVTTRCNLPGRNILSLKKMDPESDLLQLFYALYPYGAKDTPGKTKEIILDIIKTVHCHTLTVCLSALTLAVSGLDPSKLLEELKSCGVNPSSSESVEIYKDGTYRDGLMIEHLRKLLMLGNLSSTEQYILSNCALMPESGIFKPYFKELTGLKNMSDIQRLVRYGFMMDDTENERILLHPLIREVIFSELAPNCTTCRELLNELIFISHVQGVEYAYADEIIAAMLSVTEQIIIDDPSAYLEYLQNIFNYLEKYCVNDYLPKLISRMENVMTEHGLSGVTERAILINYKSCIDIDNGKITKTIKKLRKTISDLNEIQGEALSDRVAELKSNTYNNLARALYYNEQYYEALDAMENALTIRKEYGNGVLIESHDTINQLFMLARIQIATHNYDDAKDNLAGIAEMMSNAGMEGTLDDGILHHLMAAICSAKGDYNGAECNLLLAEKYTTNALGTDRELSVLIRKELFNFYTSTNNAIKAEEYKKKLMLNVSH